LPNPGPGGYHVEAADYILEIKVGYDFNYAPCCYVIAGYARAFASVKVISGELPPGIEVGTDASGEWTALRGRATERGHWFARLEMTPENDDQGRQYPSLRQTIQFHVTGSGEVHQ
jgi:hypothetical protein